ncbi:response regulator [Catenuloplanes indicus]|uniref:Two-component system KDP operon response regulator KdpE n=1 Tax=Catenuloplanes indicus TaxID=137267 RepID=A0AAE3W404_9ACTN|nr:response regulator [Catenuloplanes indicus]MDQ0369156.1 two-component system KDP operon response regulator KdpE [Catenuloplanes indicus]
MTARILLVEDEELNRVLVRAVLARADDPGVRDARLVEAGTLAAARDVLRHPDQVDVVLLDMNLPDGSGLDLATELAAIATTGKPKVIALTASVLPSDRAAAIEAGCDGFLDKPYAAADLVTVIADHLPDR